MSLTASFKRLKPAISFMLAACLIFGLGLSAAKAELYKWIDKNGGVHFTDGVENIPAGRPYEEIGGDSKLPEVKTIEEGSVGAPASPVLKEGAESSETETYVSVLKKVGHTALVKVTFNDSITEEMILDTGATHTMITSSLARRLGYNWENYSLPVIFVQSIDASIRNYLALLPSVAIGRARVERLEVIINPEFPTTQVGGLLGMNFFNNFDSSIDLNKGLVTLVPFNEEQHGRLYGGYPLTWWRYKFSYFRQNIKVHEYIYERILATDDQDLASGVAKTVSFYRVMLEDLDTMAAQATVPWKIRQAGE